MEFLLAPFSSNLILENILCRKVCSLLKMNRVGHYQINCERHLFEMKLSTVFYMSQNEPWICKEPVLPVLFQIRTHLHYFIRSIVRSFISSLIHSFFPSFIYVTESQGRLHRVSQYNQQNGPSNRQCHRIWIVEIWTSGPMHSWWC